MNWRAVAIYLAIFVAGIFVLSPGLHGPFILDDLANIVQNPFLSPTEWDAEATRKAVLGTTSGPSRRPVSMATFAANVATTGMHPLPFKITNAVLHAVTALLITLLSYRLLLAASEQTRRRALPLAALTGLAWAVHPVAITSTLYVVQRMNLLAALFTLIGMLAYLAGRQAWLERRKQSALVYLSALAVSYILGILSKENAILLPLYIFLVEALILKFRDLQGNVMLRWRKVAIALVTAGIVLGLLAILIKWSRFEASYAIRPFTLVERLLTEARVLWRYVAMILTPNHGVLGLFLDDIRVSRSLLQPLTTVFAIAGWTGVIAGIIVVRRKLPVIAFGLAFFLAGHLLESTVLPLEIAFEHRNYLPMFGLLLALVIGANAISERMDTPAIRFAIPIAFIIYCAFFTLIRSAQWSNEYVLAQLEAFHHPESARAQTNLGYVYGAFAEYQVSLGDEGWTEFFFTEAASHYEDAMKLDPHHRAGPLQWRGFAHTTGQEFPESARVELMERLANGFPTPDTPGSLKMLLECARTECGFPAGEFERLLQAALANPANRGRMAAEIYVVGSVFYRDVRQDYPTALALIAHATAVQPSDARFRLMLVQLLLESGRIGDAKEELALAWKHDSLNLYAGEIARLQKQLERVGSDRE